jgi:hypothetical protein
MKEEGDLTMACQRTVSSERQYLNWVLAVLTLCGLLSPTSAVLGAGNDPPEVTNASATVDIENEFVLFSYDLLDVEQDVIEITLKVSSDGGETYKVPVDSVEGDIGYPIAPGKGKQIIWHYDPENVSFDEMSVDGFIAKIIADDLHEVDIQELVDQVDSLNLRNDLTFIEGVRHRIAGFAHLEATKDFIEERFLSNGLQVNRHEFSFEGYSAANIIGRLPGQSQEEVTYIIDAHFDTVSNSPGADDNGSGVVGMLEAMRVLSAHNFAHTIRFIGFDQEEELGVGAGSWKYVNQAIPPYEQIEGVFNFEMIGYSCNQPNCQTLPVGFSQLFPEFYASVAAHDFRGNFIASVANENSSPIRLAFDNYADEFVPELKVLSLSVAGNGHIAPDLRRSDHAFFWDAGYQALMLSDTANFRNPNYHTANDTSGSLDFDFMANVVKATVATVAKLADIQHSGVGVVSMFNTNATTVEPAGKQPATWGQLKSMFVHLESK